MQELFKEGVSGVDYFISAMGLAIEVSEKYKTIIDYEINKITAKDLIEYVRQVLTDYTVRHIIEEGIISELGGLTRFYLLWRWAFKEQKVEFDEARKLDYDSYTGVTSISVFSIGLYSTCSIPTLC